MQELARQGVTDAESISVWRDSILKRKEHCDPNLSPAEQLEVLYIAWWISSQPSDGSSSIVEELRYNNATRDEYRMLSEAKRETTGCNVIRRWYARLQYPEKAARLLTDYDTGKFPCYHDAVNDKSMLLPQSIKRKIVGSPVCKCRRDAALGETEPDKTRDDGTTSTSRDREPGHETGGDGSIINNNHTVAAGTLDAPGGFTPVNNNNDDDFESVRHDESDDDLDWVEAALTVNAGDADSPMADITDLDTARQLATKKAAERREKSITEQQAKAAANEARRQEDLIRGIQHIEKTQIRLNKEVASGQNAFAGPMLQLIEFYSTQGNADEPDVFARSVRQNGKKLPRLESVLAIEPKRTGNAWAGDDTISYLLENVLLSGIPQDQYLVTTPSLVHQFANKEVEDGEAEKFYKRIIKENEDAHSRSEYGRYLADDMPARCTSLHIVWNPSGNHWTHGAFTVDLAAKTGRIQLRNSMHHSDGKGHSRARARVDLPYLAQITSQRPGLDWEEIVWGPVEEVECARQNNTDDCGFLVWDTARRVITNQALHLP